VVFDRFSAALCECAFMLFLLGAGGPRFRSSAPCAAVSGATREQPGATLAG